MRKEVRMKNNATFAGTFSICYGNIEAKYETKSQVFLYVGAIR
jgi:hypothetical protein